MQLVASVVLEANSARMLLEANPVRLLSAWEKSLCGQSDIQACRQDIWRRNKSMFSLKHSSIL
jgi:hypothetical protein